ncbi:carbohydrate-binding module family 48 [Melampsora larici-populina 98AG31]|uniref:Carbohydrate-binding module family 48 n=1 Tax=Melampsora larici-populina (strain 98AG31 / pathotype 3-4-7) TaxID=747676 RepID=F4R7L9_MELLP|nr:carbohydrate-binding module family 48 [Melampsora larici-populina 98AG31]EGG11337.1 carbohydrate-binding module family 48 [Melampsora larici-populina 98AG31]
MGNNASSNLHSGSSRKSSSKISHHTTAAASLSSFNTQSNNHYAHNHNQKQTSSSSSPRTLFNSTNNNNNNNNKRSLSNQARRRKSLDFPDLEPSYESSPTVPTRREPTNHISHPDANPSNPSHRLSSHGFQDLAQFQLKLPARERKSPALRSTTSSSSTCPGVLTGIEAMRLDAGEDFIPQPEDHTDSKIPPVLLGFSNLTATVDPGEPPEPKNAQQPGQTLPASPSLIQPDPDLNPDSNDIPPLFPPLDVSTATSLPPLQQPVETVVPPLPPAILQPFPPPLPDLASIDEPVPKVGAALTTAVTETIAAATAVVQAAPALDIGAGPEGVPTLITWKEPANEVYVTGTFSKWKQQIKLRKPPVNNEPNQENNFSALVALPPGPHRLKFIVDKRWKTSKYLPSATDDKGNLINYLQVNPGDQPFRGLGPRGIWSGYTYANWSLGSSIGGLSGMLEEEQEEEERWTTEIPSALISYEEYHDEEGIEGEEEPGPNSAGFAAEPPKLPAQLKEGILNISSRLTDGLSISDDNSLLPKPDHSVLNHLAASPIKQGLLSVGVTSRYKRKYLTTVYYKPVDL